MSIHSILCPTLKITRGWTVVALVTLISLVSSYGWSLGCRHCVQKHAFFPNFRQGSLNKERKINHTRSDYSAIFLVSGIDCLILVRSQRAILEKCCISA